MTPGLGGEGGGGYVGSSQSLPMPVLNLHLSQPPFHFSSHLPMCTYAIQILGLSLYGQEFYKLSFQIIFQNCSCWSFFHILQFLLQTTFFYKSLLRTICFTGWCSRFLLENISIIWQIFKIVVPYNFCANYCFNYCLTIKTITCK